MLRNALREYDSVSADSTTAAGETSAARLAVDVRRLPWMRPLVGDYAFNFSKIAAFYAGDPQSPDAWHDAAKRVRAQRRSRAEMAQCVAAQQERRGAPPACRDAAARLTDPQTVAVVTGQQAGAFGGPLFTLLKAISALQLAHHASTLLGTPVVAVFWVDAEDHDWDEIASCTVLDAQYQPRTVTLPAPEGAGELPIAKLRPDERVLESVEALGATLPRTEFTDWTLDLLRTSYRPGVGMAESFATWLESVLGPHGLIVFDAADSSTKRLVADVFKTEIASPGQTAALAAKAGERLAALGHAPQVVPQADSVSLFYLDGARKPIKRQGDQFVVGDRSYPAEALAAEIAARPEQFSPNVLLRPIVQDTLFPTICYVSGPSELAYLGQLREVYQHFGVAMPLVHPRASATLVDSATQRFLTKYGVALEDLQPQDESALNKLLQSQLPPTVEAAIKEADEAVARVMQHVVQVIPAVDPTLAGAAKTTLGKMEHEIRSLHGKVIQAVKKRDETLRRQFTRAQVQTFPQGQPQERVLGVPFFLNLYGSALVDRLLQELPSDVGRHYVITI
jgi:bacillithiol biosynthesis cysteine-adding enzyme BshC